MIAQIFNATEKLVIPTVIPTNEANADIEAQTLTTEPKQESVQSNLKVYPHFYAFHSLNHYVSLLLKCNFSLAEDFSLFGCVFASLIPAF